MMSPSRIPRDHALLLKGFVVVLAVGLSFPATHLHRGVHERARAASEARIACHHAPNAPDHFESTVNLTDVPCTACLTAPTLGAESLPDTAHLKRPPKAGLCATTAVPTGQSVASRLPAPRAPPLL
jgi:hypothetical protein